jgi:hypothetical protein
MAYRNNLLGYIYDPPYKWYTSIEPPGYSIWPPTDGIATPCLWCIDPIARYFDPSTHGIPNPYGILGSLIMVYRTPCLLYVDLFALGISNSLLMAFWPLTTHRISKHLPIGYQTLYQWYIEPPAYGISPLLTHGIYNRLPIVFWFLSMVISNRQSMIYRTHYYGILNPLLMVFWSTHGVSKPSLCYFHITTHDISNPWLWYFSPYPWCIKPSAYGIFNPIPKVYRTASLWGIVHPTHGISNSIPIVYWHTLCFFDPSTNGIPNPYGILILIHGISNPLSVVYRAPYPKYIESFAHDILTPLRIVYITPTLWYFDPIPMVPVYRTSSLWNIYSLPMVYRTDLHIFFRPLFMEYQTPIHGILTPTHGISNSLPMVFQPPPNLWYIETPANNILSPYAWYIEPPSYGILNPLPMVYWTLCVWYFDLLPMVCRTTSHSITNVCIYNPLPKV